MTNNSVFKNRLLKLADFLDNLPEERFNFDHWVGNDWGGKANLSCNTTGCALGWASSLPSFRKLGLRLVLNPDLKSTFKFIVALKEEKFPSVYSYAIACTKIFGLKRDESAFLFTSGASWFGHYNELTSNATPEKVAANIRRFISLKEW